MVFFATLALFAAKVFEMQKNNEMAAKMYQVAAMEGDLYSIRAMADMLMTGTGCKQDSNKAMQFYEQAAIRGEKVSCFVMGEFERNKGNIEFANAWYAKSLVRGYDPAAQRIQAVHNTERNIQDDHDEVYNEDPEMTKAKELFDTAEQLREANQKKEAKACYQKAYDLGWAPAKRFLDEILYWEKQKERGKEFNELIKQGKITSVNLGAVPNFKDSASIDADFCDKIEKYVSYLISCNQTNEALTYLYDVLFERLNNSKSKQLIAEKLYFKGIIRYENG